MRDTGPRKRGSTQYCSLRYLIPALALVSVLSLYLLYDHVLMRTAIAQDIHTDTGDVSQISEKVIHPPVHTSSSYRPVRRRIAYAITMTKDGPFQDGAAVLAYSIMKISKSKDYDTSLVAFIHPEVITSRPILRKLGYHVIECPTPINTTAIKFDFLREKINKNGCCGAAELIKLNSYRLLQYDRVVHIDADTFFLNPIDELFSRNYSLIYTTDPNMASYKKKIEQFPVQGGFIGK